MGHMTTDQGDGDQVARTPLDALADAFAALQTAREYGYDTTAAFSAVMVQVDGLDRQSLAAMVSMLAAFLATEMKPRADMSFDLWAGMLGWILATRDGEQ